MVIIMMKTNRTCYSCVKNWRDKPRKAIRDWKNLWIRSLLWKEKWIRRVRKWS